MELASASIPEIVDELRRRSSTGSSVGFFVFWLEGQQFKYRASGIPSPVGEALLEAILEGGDDANSSFGQFGPRTSDN